MTPFPARTSLLDLDFTSCLLLKSDCAQHAPHMQSEVRRRIKEILNLHERELQVREAVTEKLERDALKTAGDDEHAKEEAKRNKGQKFVRLQPQKGA